MAMSIQADGAQTKMGQRVRKLPFGLYVSDGIVWLLLAMVAIVEILPIMWMFSTSLRLPADSYELPPDFLPTAWRWENYMSVLNSAQINFPVFFLNSLKIALLVTGAQLLTCSMAAFAFARLRFRGRDVLFFMFLASMMVPGQVTTIPLFILVRRFGLIDTHAALILPALTSAFGIFLLRQFFMTLPSELMDAAKIDGAGFFYIYWRITLPLVGPGLSALGIFTFLGQWNNFYGPLLFLRSWDKLTLPIGLVILQGYMGDGSPVQILAGVMMSVFPVLVVYLFTQRYVLQGIALTGMKA
jgi:multiple sugar transport system permease protein